MVNHIEKADKDDSELKKELQRSREQLEHLTQLVKTLESKTNDGAMILSIVTGLLEVTDVIQEEGVVTRNTFRELADSLAPTISPVQPPTPLEDCTPTIAAALTRDKSIKKNVSTSSIPSGRERTSRVPAQVGITTQVNDIVPVHPTVTQSQKGGVVFTKEMLDEFVGKSQEDIAKEFTRRERERRDEQKEPEYLTDNEKTMGATSLSALDRLWRQKAGYQIKVSDHIEIGNLTSDQLELPRHNIRTLIRNRRAAEFIARMKADGRQLNRCEKCLQLYPVDGVHNCFFAAGWSRQTKKDGLPADKGILFSQHGKGGVSVRPRTAINADKINTNYRKMVQYKMVAGDEYKPIVNEEKGEQTDTTMVINDDATEVIIDQDEDQRITVDKIDEDHTPKVALVQDGMTGQVFRLIPC
jgi:hypothetical protein